MSSSQVLKLCVLCSVFSFHYACKPQARKTLLPAPLSQSAQQDPEAEEELGEETRPTADPRSGENRSYSNPIMDDGADPWVMQKDGVYYRSYSDGDSSIWVTRFTQLDRMRDEKATLVWRSPAGTPYSKQIWAPELHFLDGRWYIYFAASDGDNVNHRQFVIEGTSADPQGSYQLKGRLTAATDRWAIDGTVFEAEAGKRYFIWSGWDGLLDGQQNLYIAPMLNPWTLAGSTAASATYEAEVALIQDAKPRTSASASGGQAVGLIDLPSSFVEFQINIPSNDRYLIEIRYSNGTGGTSSHQLSLDGLALPEISYPSTQGWENWQTVATSLNLAAGNHTIRLGKGSSFAEVDRIDIKLPGVDRVVLSVPTEEWETRGARINEGPQILKRKEMVHLVYSASASWTDDYTLGLMTLTGKDPMDPRSWTKLGQVFAKTEQVYGPGHPSFVQSPDASEDWMIYHAAKTKGSGWDRNIRMQKFRWDERDRPVFGLPLAPGQLAPAPREMAPAVTP